MGASKKDDEKLPLDGVPISIPMRVLVVADIMLRIAILGVVMPVLYPLHMVLKSLNNAASGRMKNVAYTPIETFNVLIGKSICWGLGVRLARAGTENFVDDRGAALKVCRARPSNALGKNPGVKHALFRSFVRNPCPSPRIFTEQRSRTH